MSERGESPATSVRHSGAEVSFRFYREGDAAALLTLLQTAFDGWPSVEITVDPVEHLRWKLRSDVCRHHLVAEADDRIVGMLLLWARPARVRERVLMQWMGADLAVHPDYRQLGILNGLRDMRHEAFRNVFDFVTSRSSDQVAVARSRSRHSDLRPFGNRVQVLERPLTQASAPSAVFEHAAWTVREIDAFDERVARLCEEASASFDFMLLRDAEFLNWRYCDARAGRYAALVAEEAGRVLGYAVVQVSHGRGYLSDVLVLPDRMDVLDSLVAKAIDYLKDAGVGVAITWRPTLHWYSAVLERHGFLVRPSRTRELAYRPLHRRAEAELSFLQDAQTRLHFTTGDVDVV